MKKWFGRILMASVSSALLIAACSSNENTTTTSSTISLGVPNTEKIVSESSPTGATSTARMQVNRSLMASSANNCGLDNSSTESDFISCLKGAIFQENTSVPSSYYYLYWIKTIDEQMSGLEKRFETKPDCFSQDPTTVDLSFTLNGTAVKESMSFSCWETHTPAANVVSEDMAVGKNSDGEWSLMLRTKFSADSANIVIVKVKDTTAKIWVIGKGDDSAPTPTKGVNILRIIANSSVKEMSFNYANTLTSTGLCDIYLRNDASNVFLTGTPGGSISDSGNTDHNTCSLNAAITFTDNGCKLNSDLGSAGSGCSGTLDSVPSNFGPASIIKGSHLSASTFITEVDTILAIDYDAQGIGDITASDVTASSVNN